MSGDTICSDDELISILEHIYSTGRFKKLFEALQLAVIAHEFILYINNTTSIKEGTHDRSRLHYDSGRI